MDFTSGQSWQRESSRDICRELRLQHTEDRLATCNEVCNDMMHYHHYRCYHLVRGALVRPDELRRLTQPDQVTLGRQLQALGLRPLLEETQSETSDMG